MHSGTLDRAAPRRSLLPTSLLILAVACGGDAPPAEPPEDGTATAEAPVRSPETLPEGAQAWSLLGEPLYPPPISDEARAVYEENLAAARAAWENTPENPDSIIWYGRRLAYLGRYREAIDIYTRGIALHPEDARMYRHRGHRYVTVRQFDDAIDDLRRGVELTEGEPDRVEPDGLPNALGIPTSTLQFNLWYHLGLAHYLAGEFEQALLAWNSCLDVSEHIDSVVATTYWLNNTLRRLGLEERADSLIAGIGPGVEDEIIEVGEYLRVLRTHQAGEPVEGLADGETSLSSVTARYGLGMWHFVNGRRDRAYGIFEEVLEEPQWSGFGYIAAEAEMARLEGETP